MRNQSSWEQFNSMPIVGIMRHLKTDDVLELAALYLECGLSTLEVTCNSKEAFHQIQTLSNAFGDKLNIGAGTICTIQELDKALLAGAEFIVTPVYNDEIVKVCVQTGVPVFCGAYTPTEIYNAWKSGASMVKVFPARSLGSTYIKDVLAPLNEIRLLPTGGIDENNFIEYLKAGASGVGMGSNLFPSDRQVDIVRLRSIYTKIVSLFSTIEKDR